MITRLEADSIGEKEIDSEAYYGVQSLRANENFPITGIPMHSELIKALAQLKRASAMTNRDSGRLDGIKAHAIIQACDEIIEGKLHGQFIVDAIQGGAGTSANMNANEEHCSELLHRSVGIATALKPYIGYKKAADIAKESLKTGVPVKDIVLRDGLFSEEQLAEILEPKNMTEIKRLKRD